ncbi:MAG: methionyl-tRNA formyltransferase [Candidatus Eisenbacteria sp.]|nr:methionyl-tRNA formyltransferase [Candidatus Eisenbacteria bacterium]
MSILFAGSPEFAVPSLRELQRAGLSPAAVVTQPDRPRGRGRRIESPAVKEEALRLGLRVEQPRRFSSPEFLDVLRPLKPDLLVVVAYGQILKPAALALFEKGCINLHPSLLPRLRGAAPINWSIINGDKYTGLTTFFLNEEMDAGDIIFQEKAEIHENETAGELGRRLACRGAELLVRAVGLVMEGRAARIAQDDSQATLAPRLQKTDGRIDWRAAARRVHGIIMGTNPWPGAATQRAGLPLLLWRSKIWEETGFRTSGEVLDVRPEGIVVGCGKGSVLVTEVQTPGKRRIPAGAFARGYRVERGERWGEEKPPSTREG